MKKEKRFKFTPQVFLRLVIFIIIVFFAFNYLSQKQSPQVLGDLTLKPYSDWAYSQLPPASRNLVENFSSNPSVMEIQKKIDDVKLQLNGFPDTQIKEIQKQIIQNVSDKLIKSIENK